MRRDIRRVIEHLCDTENRCSTGSSAKLMRGARTNAGFGPLEILLKDPRSAHPGERPAQVHVERRGKLEKTK